MRNLGLKKRAQSSPGELDITSLLDILVILLVFLLQNYHITKIEIDLKNNVNIPFSITQSHGINAAVIQVTKDKEVWFNKIYIGNLEQGSSVYLKLRDTLIAHKKGLGPELKAPASAPEGDLNLDELREIRHSVNLVFDEGLNYAIMKNVMNAAAGSGFPKFKFIVRSES